SVDSYPEGLTSRYVTIGKSTRCTIPIQEPAAISVITYCDRKRYVCLRPSRNCVPVDGCRVRIPNEVPSVVTVITGISMSNRQNNVPLVDRTRHVNYDRTGNNVVPDKGSITPPRFKRFGIAHFGKLVISFLRYAGVRFLVIEH